MRTTHTTTTAAILLTTATLLTACTQPTTTTNTNQPTTTTSDTTTPTTTTAPTTAADIHPITSEPPTSEQEAITYANQALQTWIIVGGDILSNTPNDTSRAEHFATGNELQELSSDIQWAKDEGFDFDGTITITIDDSQTFTTPLVNGDEQMDYTVVHLFGCQDDTTLGGTTAAGDPIQYTGEIDGFPIHVTVVYDPVSKHWLVDDSVPDWENEKTRC